MTILRARVRTLTPAAPGEPIPPPPPPLPPPPPPAPGDWPYGFYGWSPSAVTDRVITLSPGNNVQAALNDLGTTGGTLLLNPGDYPVNLQWNERPTSPAVRVRTNTSNIPPSGTRITRAYASGLATLRSANTYDGLLVCGHRAKHLYFEGVRFGPQHYEGNMVVLGWDKSTLRSTSQRASGFLFDRCLFDGDPVNGQHRGIMAHAKDIIVRDCSFYDFHERGRDSQCIAGWNGTENILIERCYLEASGENVMFGGASSAAIYPEGAGMEPRNVTIRDCWMNKQISWMSLPNPPAVKALFELKHLRGLLMERCLLEHNWNSGWPSAVGLVIKCLNDEALDWQGNPSPHSEPTNKTVDCLFRDLIIRHMGVAITTIGQQDTGPSSPTQRMENVRYRNILCYNINQSPYNGQDQAQQLVNCGNGTEFDHITWRTNGHSIVQAWWDNGPTTATGFRYTNNAVSAASYGLNMLDDPNALPGETMVNKYNNMLPGHVTSGNAVRQGNDNPVLSGLNYISAANWDASFASDHAVIPGSAVANVTTTDGQLPGANVPDLKAKMPWVTF